MRMLDASCQGGIVTADGVQVDAAEILSAGKGRSAGTLLLDGEKAVYLTSNAADLDSALEKIGDSITKILNILTAIGGGMTGPTTATPPTLPTDIAEVTAIAAQIETLREALK